MTQAYRLLFLDTETTGVDPQKSRLVQLAYATCDHGDALIEIKSKIFYPPIPCELDAMATHHITPPVYEKAGEFSGSTFSRDFAGALDQRVPVAHNAAFDLQILKNEGIEMPKYHIDTLNVAKHLLPDLETHKLQALRYYFKIYDLKADAHDAAGDVAVLEAVFWELAGLAGKKIGEPSHSRATIIEMIKLTIKPVTLIRLPFGKYKGVRFDEVIQNDRGYLEWLLNSETKKLLPDQNGGLVFTLRTYLFSQSQLTGLKL